MVFLALGNTADYQSKSFTLGANTWKKVTVTVSGASSLSIDDRADNASGLQLRIIPDYGTAYSGGSEAVENVWYYRTQSNGYVPNFTQDWQNTSGATFEITGVQLEVGDTATPFEHRSYGDELARCQRYYYKIGGVSGKKPVICNAMAYSAHELYGVLRLPVPMRTIPSGSYDGLPRGYKPGAAERLTLFAINSTESTEQEIRLQGNITGYFTAGDASWIQIDSFGEYLDFDAEL